MSSALAPLLKPLQVAINQYLALDPESPRLLARFDNKVIELVAQPPGLSLFIMLTPAGLDLLDDADSPADTRIIGSPMQLGLMGLRSSSADSVFEGGVTIEGDTQLGQQFQAFLKQIEVDPEEPLAMAVGDVTAHQLGQQLRNLATWASASAESFQSNLSEFLQHETRTVPGYFEVNRFTQSVDQLRLDSDRLEARIQRLSLQQAAEHNA